MMPDNSRHLVEAARRGSDATLARAEQALQDRREDQPASVAAFARIAGVSRTWLYEQHHILAQVKANIAEAPAVPRRDSATAASLLRRLEVAQQQITRLRQDNRRLNDQLAVGYSRIRSERDQ